MDLSEAYDCLPCDFLLANYINLINLVLIWLMIMYVFKNKGKKIGSSYSDWANSILRLLILMFLSMTFSYLLKIICNFADDNVLILCGDNLLVILTSLEYVVKTLLIWFNLNSLKVNPGSFNL